MFKQLSNSFMTVLSSCAGFLGNYLNQLPEKALHQKTRIYQAAPWLKKTKTHESNRVNKSVQEDAKGTAHSDSKIFNHPRR